MQINFQAKYIRNEYIPRKGTNDLEKVSIIKFTKLHKNDQKALDVVAKSWKKITGDKSTYANDMCIEFREAALLKKDEFKREFYGLTLQQEDFETINPSKILGLAEISTMRTSEDFILHILDYLETHPNNVYNNENREYMNIGKVLLKFIDKKLKGLPTALLPTKMSEQMYLNNGYKKSPNIDFLVKNCDEFLVLNG